MAGGEWAERSFPKNNTVASRLKPCTEYEFQVEAVIEGTPAGYSPSRHFTTLGCEAQEAVATVPENLRAVSPTDASVTLTWTSVAGATGYQVQYKIAGQPTAQSQTVTRNGLVLKGLRPETLYLWRVRAVMGASQGPYAPVADFSTSGQLYASSRVAASPGWMTVSFQQPGIVELSLATTLQMQVDISMLDASQTLIKSWTDRTVVPGRSLPLQVMGLPAGTYYLVVRDVSGFETIREVYIEG
jgi:hypothetical protein